MHSQLSMELAMSTALEWKHRWLFNFAVKQGLPLWSAFVATSSYLGQGVSRPGVEFLKQRLWVRDLG